MSFNGRRSVPHPVNEPVKSYAPGSPERAELKERLHAMASETADIPLVIDGQAVRTGHTDTVVMPHAHRHELGDYHVAGPNEVEHAIKSAVAAQKEWSSWAWEDRAAVFLRAAELLATTWRSTLNAATMLGQSKTAFQAEIDSACELVDFWRYNPYFAEQLYSRAAGVRSHRRGISSSIAASKASCMPSRRSTSRRSAATCRRRRP